MSVGMAVPRAASSASPVGSPARLPNLPIIEHPLSRLGDRHDLSVRGSATYAGSRKVDFSMQRSNTVMDVKGSNTLKDNKSSSDRILNWPPVVGITPPFKYKEQPSSGFLPEIDSSNSAREGRIPSKVDKYPKVGAIPNLPPLPSIDEQEEFLKGPGKPFIKSKEYNFQPRTTQELIELIREKFGTGYYGIRHLFRSSDPTGKGAVSREALQRIMYTLCGYITPDQYNKLLKAMSLDGKSPINFDTFVQYFKDTEDKKNWVSALQTSSMHQSDKSYAEGYLRRGDLKIHDPYTSMPFSDAIFKEKCKSKNFDAHKVFPSSVFEPDGLIVPPQLREAYATLGIYMTDDDFNKLWQRYDKEGTGALHTESFFRVCGLDSQGRPQQASSFTPRGAAYPLPKQRPHSEIGHTDGLDSTIELKKILKNEDIVNSTISTNMEIRTKPPGDKPTGKDESEVKDNVEEKDSEQKIDIKRPLKATPKLDNIIDCLHYKFEESYQAMLTAFQLFDFMNDGYVSKVDFRRVLLEFGFSMSPLDLEHFLKKNNLRTIKGQINYKEFLLRFQNKSLSSVLARTAADQPRVLNGDASGSTPGLTADDIDSRLIDYFHGDFIKLLTHFRQCDRYNIGVITCHEFRSGIEKRLGYGMTESQWDQLKATVGLDKDGLIQYTKFLELFDITPGAWNIKQEGGIQVTQVRYADIPTPREVERLKRIATTEFVHSGPALPLQQDSENLRSLEEIKTELDELFKNRFHTFDKHFKAMDRKMTGRMSKWQFGALLKMCDFSLQPKELDKLWATLNVSTDGMYSYSTLIQHFVSYKVPHEEKERVIFENMFNLDEAEQIWYDPGVMKHINDVCLNMAKEDTTELVETAKRIQRERREEQMKRDHLARIKFREQNEEWKPEKANYTQQSPRVFTAASGVSLDSIPSLPASRASFASVQSVRTKSLLVKVRTDVINNWDGLKSVFKYIDRNGTAFIPTTEMKEIMTSMQFSLDEVEKAELCKRFDTQRNGKFNYLQFMKCYAQKQKKQEQHPPFVQSKVSHQLKMQFLKEHRNLHRAFKKLDHDHKGFVSVQHFRNTLKACGVVFTNEDFYHILTEFDYKMDGRISYERFIRSVLTM